MLRLLNVMHLFRLSGREVFFLTTIYLIGLYLRLAPRLAIDSHLLTFQGDIWYRLCMAQYIFDNAALPEPDIRYEAYGYVPMWYPPASPVFFALLSHLSGLDIPTVSSRIIPFIESIAPLSLYFLARYLYNQKIAASATATLALTPSFVFWSGISDPQSFTLFMIPLFVLLWIWHSKQPSNLRLLGIGILLAINFITHLSYFVEILVLLMVTIALIVKKEAEKWLLLDLGKTVLLSQLITSPWWFISKLDMPAQFSLIQKNLYWWWINALVTSSGMYKPAQQLEEYGTFAALAGIVAFIYVLSKGKKHLLLVLWALPLILETQNEVILSAANRIELAWSTLAKPLEGYRFYCFLAQPLAIAVGVALSDFLTSRFKKKITLLVIALFFFWLITGVYQYNTFARFQNSGLIVEEYEAAKWFRDYSKPGDRIIADYYRAQMFGGVLGGRVLQGGEFPLRNVDYSYIKAPGEVLNHLFILYNTSDAKIAYEIAKRYNATHIFYSDNMIRYGNLLSYYKSASEYGVDTDKKKFLNGEFFEAVYKKDSPYGEIVIVRVK